MSRATLTNTKYIVLAIMAVVIAGGSGWIYNANHAARIHTVSNAQHHITEISYRGENGIDALSLLKKHAVVGIKHYSFGDMVTSIDGSAGAGPKYWTFYVNGKEASVGASSYHTHSSDIVLWKLQ